MGRDAVEEKTCVHTNESLYVVHDELCAVVGKLQNCKCPWFILVQIPEILPPSNTLAVKVVCLIGSGKDLHSDRAGVHAGCTWHEGKNRTRITSLV